MASLWKVVICTAASRKYANYTKLYDVTNSPPSISSMAEIYFPINAIMLLAFAIVIFIINQLD